MSDWRIELQRQYFESCYDVGIINLSDYKCCQILAWTSVYGGGHEAVVTNPKLTAAIFTAQKRLNIFGSEIPDNKLIPIMLEYIKSVTDFDNPPEWVPTLEKEYGIKSYRSKKK
ncbi:MAG: hypothetical protein LBH43_01475 [Treponema sp.]|jgi:hypothetical protein|nr:hypothetical protein [Treponema sp.]